MGPDRDRDFSGIVWPILCDVVSSQSCHMPETDNMSTDMGQAFGKVLASHRDAPTATAMTPIRDPSFAVHWSALDAPFFSDMMSVLSNEPQVR